MQPNERWLSDWHIDSAPSREKKVAGELLEIFISFWEVQGLNEKSKSTKNRYSGSLQALGGYLVEMAVSAKYRSMPARDLILEHISEFDGPLIHYDNEVWQNEIDMVCRKLYKFLRKKDVKRTKVAK
ncbi:MAG: hypothetical protein WAM73_03310 [Desulfobacterales bacterium]